MKYALLGLALLSSGSAQAATPSVNVRYGNIICTRSDGTHLKLTTSGKDAEPALAPDGRSVAFTRVLKKQVPYEWGSVRSALWLGDCQMGGAHEIVPSNPDIKRDHLLFDARYPHFSEDGRYVYFSTSDAPTSAAIHRFDIKSGAENFIVSANLESIIRTGPYRGDLIANQHTCEPQGGCNYPIYIFSPDGKTIERLNGSESWDAKQEQFWLKQKGWQAW